MVTLLTMVVPLQDQMDGTQATALTHQASLAPTVMLTSIVAPTALPITQLMEPAVQDHPVHHPKAIQCPIFATMMIINAKWHGNTAKPLQMLIPALMISTTLATTYMEMILPAHTAPLITPLAWYQRLAMVTPPALPLLTVPLLPLLPLWTAAQVAEDSSPLLWMLTPSLQELLSMERTPSTPAIPPIVTTTTYTVSTSITSPQLDLPILL
jgi:hypothetical protein